MGFDTDGIEELYSTITGTQFTCFTGTKVKILPQNPLAGFRKGLRHL
jgi:hypothetical protein